MANVTYWDLKRGHILDQGDTILIYGIHYTVTTGGGYYLYNTTGRNDEVFVLLGMNDEQKKKWASKYGYNYDGMFPEFKSRNDLTKFVIDIMQTPIVKPGDRVVIKPRVGVAGDYPFLYTDAMAELAGKSFIVDKVSESCNESTAQRKYFNGDIHSYQLRDCCFYWNSAHFDLKSIVRKSSMEETLARLAEETKKKSALEMEALSLSSISKMMKDYSAALSEDKEETSSKGIVLNKPKKHFKTKIVL